MAAGNFSITAALAKQFALLAARYLPSWEIIDYAHADKMDAPSGTTRELAEELAAIARNRVEIPISDTHGNPQARGAAIAGTQIHSIRLPSFVIAFETLFGLPNERLTIRHDAGPGAMPYVAGTMLAIDDDKRADSGLGPFVIRQVCGTGRCESIGAFHMMQSFRPPYSQAAVDDLRHRLRQTRWPETVPVDSSPLGMDRESMKDLCDYWMNDFDWESQIKSLATFRHYRYQVKDGYIHFIHERGKGPSPMPLILTHGWPGSFLEMLKIVLFLTDPAAYGHDAADSSDVIVPSLPGFGYSDRPEQLGMNFFRIAEICVELMGALGYQRFAAQGGDLGAGVSTGLGLRHSEHVIGIHLNYIPGSYRPYLPPGESQKFREWSDCEGDVYRSFTRDELLRNVTLYWMTQTISSSFRMYYEGRKAPLRFASEDFVHAPCAIAHFPREIPFPPQEWVERGYNVQRWTKMPRGGHFAAAEQPDLLAADIRAFFRPLRQ